MILQASSSQLKVEAMKIVYRNRLNGLQFNFD